MNILKKHRLITLLSLAGLLFCTPALAQGMDPGQQSTSPTPMPFNTGNTGTTGNNATTGAIHKATKSNDSPSLNPQQQAGLLLSGYHNIPPKSVFDEKLDQPQKVLMGFALGEKTLPLQRRRALEALAYYADAQVEALYRDLLEDKESPEMLRHRVMGLFANSFPKTALPVLQPFLEHSDLQYRLSAIDAIRRIPGNGAHQALQTAAKSEDNKLAQKRLAQYLRTTR